MNDTPPAIFRAAINTSRWLALLLAFSACSPAKTPPAQPAARPAAANSLPSAPIDLHFERPPLSEDVAGSSSDSLLDAAVIEVSRSIDGLSTEPLAPHYLAYWAYDTHQYVLAARDGNLNLDDESRQRSLEVDIRLGSPSFDNTHGDQSGSYLGLTPLPIEDDELALRRPIWLATEQAYREARDAYLQARADSSVGAVEGSESADFSPTPRVRHVEPEAALHFDRELWTERIKAISKRLARSPHLQQSEVALSVGTETRYFVSSEGSQLRTSHPSTSLRIRGSVTTLDGAVLERTEETYADTPDGLPSPNQLYLLADSVGSDLAHLMAAPLAQPYIGPVLLDGLGAAVLFHEVLGHRAEGHRLGSDSDGRTFKDMVGQQVMPGAFSVIDDPTVSRLNGLRLNGFYDFDDEGVRAQPTWLVRNGLFKGFLMSRAPAPGFSRSNGHGRKQPGFRAVSRQGNLLLLPDRVTTPKALREAFLDEVRAQGKPYGLRISRVSGGDTQTTVFDPQAFQVRPVLAYKVYTDGSEELVRGVKIEGTPLSLLANVIAASNDFSVFNGYCSAESGQVPVSAISPSLLVKRLEVTRAPQSGERPPLLPPPATTSEASLLPPPATTSEASR